MVVVGKGGKLVMIFCKNRDDVFLWVCKRKNRGGDVVRFFFEVFFFSFSLCLMVSVE